MAYCIFCGDTGKWKTLSGGKNIFSIGTIKGSDLIISKRVAILKIEPSHIMSFAWNK
jgi:hypothetical protein